MKLGEKNQSLTDNVILSKMTQEITHAHQDHVWAQEQMSYFHSHKGLASAISAYSNISEHVL